ncbi:hypothetical protein [Salinicola avicenniae]|uniref:hypothetical protein n=1 Tax=Salinicola avicenniae TaxID=2916836 RepID=UPI0020739A47|nr:MULTISPECIES: hypothetical protein [unclassified Salinicola]
MKTRILAAIAIAIALPAAAQASEATSEHFVAQREALNTQQITEHHALPTAYAFDTALGGHSAAADQAFANIGEATELATYTPASGNPLVGDGQSAAAAEALQTVTQPSAPQSHGSVEVNFASL